MDKKRREFLKVAGISTLAGLGAPAVVDRLISGANPIAARASEGHGPATSGAGSEHSAKEQMQDTKPTGKRYGLVIDTVKFNQNPGLAEKCITACNNEHNIPNFPNKKDEIKWIWLTNYENGFPEHSHYYRSEKIEDNQVIVLCNHCDKPPCVRACPTKATYKSKDGIVMMDFHRCIGCRFCMAACPYGSRSFNWRNPREAPNLKNPPNREFPTRMRGVVEKCNFCAKRLAVGKKPACVEAAGDSKAMIFGDLNDPNSELRNVLTEKYTIQRKPSMGTHPSVFYIV